MLFFSRLFETVAFLMDMEKNKAWKLAPFHASAPDCDYINIKYPKIVGALLW
jgi:hypothetical protein